MDILNELARTLVEAERVEAAKARRLVRFMSEAFPEALVEGYEGLVETVEAPDPDDRHVLAAGIRGQASAVVTSNIKDFPKDAEERYGLRVISPDDFLAEFCEEDPESMRIALEAQVAPYDNPSMTVGQLLGKLDLPLFAGCVKTRTSPAR